MGCAEGVEIFGERHPSNERESKRKRDLLPWRFHRLFGEQALSGLPMTPRERWVYTPFGSASDSGGNILGG